jgi:hypothetical protein
VYYKELETSAGAKRQHNENNMKWAAERLKKVSSAKAAKKKAKKAG